MNRLEKIVAALKTAADPVGVILAPQLQQNWTTDADFILDNTHKYTDMHGGTKTIGRFAYNPATGELVWGPIEEQHAAMIHNQATSPFDDFVRGVYDGNKIMLRWYNTDPYSTPDEIQAQSFDAWWDTKKMLEDNGIPGGMEIQLGVDTGSIKNELGGELGRFYR